MFRLFKNGKMRETKKIQDRSVRVPARVFSIRESPGFLQ